MRNFVSEGERDRVMTDRLDRAGYIGPASSERWFQKCQVTQNILGRLKYSKKIGTKTFYTTSNVKHALTHVLELKLFCKVVKMCGHTLSALIFTG